MEPGSWQVTQTADSYDHCSCLTWKVKNGVPVLQFVICKLVLMIFMEVTAYIELIAIFKPNVGTCITRQNEDFHFGWDYLRYALVDIKRAGKYFYGEIWVDMRTCSRLIPRHEDPCNTVQPFCSAKIIVTKWLYSIAWEQ